MASKAYTVWCEYDIGQEGLVFGGEKVAWDHACEMAILQDLDPSLLIEDGLLGLEEIEIVSQ